MHYYEYVEMFIAGMTRLTGEFTPEYYEELFTRNALNADYTERLLNELSKSDYDAMHVLELKDYLSNPSGCDVDEYAWSFMRSIDLMENLNSFCARNEVPEVSKAYIIDKIILTINKVWQILLQN